MKVNDKLIKAFEKFNEDLKAFGEEKGEVFVMLYEDPNTTREVANFKLCKNGKLTWIELEWTNFYSTQVSKKQEYIHDSEEEIRDTLKFWRANLRRAKRYWEMNSETLDKIQDGEIEDTEEE